MKLDQGVVKRRVGSTACAILAVLSLFCGGDAQAAVKTWANAGTDFNTDGNWLSSGVPGAGDDVWFTNAVVAQPNLSSSLSVRSLTFATNAVNYALSSSSPATKLTLVPPANGRVIQLNNISGTTNTIDLPIILGAAAGTTNEFNMATPPVGGLVINGAISEANPGVTLLLRFGYYKLTGVNTYSGDTLINGSGCSATISSLGNAGASGNLGMGTNIHIYGTLYYTGAGETSSKVINMYSVGKGATIDTTGASGGLVLTADMMATATGAHPLILTGDSAGNEIRGRIVDGNGTTDLTKDGTGAWALTGTNTYSGGSQLRLGGLVIGNKSAFGTGVVDIRGVNISASTDLSGANAITNAIFLSSNPCRFTGSNAIEFSSTVTNAYTAFITNDITAASLKLSGNVFLSSADTARTVTIGGTGTTMISGNIANNNVGNTVASLLTYTGSGMLVLSGTNTYSGTTTVSGGVLKLDGENALPGGIGSSGGRSLLKLNGGVAGLCNGEFARGTGTGTNQVQFAAPGGGFAAYGGDRVVNLGGSTALVTWNAATFVPNGSYLLLGAGSADSMVDFRNPIALGSLSRTVRVDDGLAAVDARLSGVLTSSSTNGGLVKTGLGTLELAGANTYTGPTTNTAGRLLVNGTTSGQGHFVVNAGSTLGGTGTVGLAAGKAVTIEAGGTVAPGVSGVGTLSVGGGFVLGENASYAWDFKDGEGDRVSITGALQLPSVATVTVTRVSGAMPDPALLFSAGSVNAIDLSGWVFSGHYSAKVIGSNVYLLKTATSTLVLFR